ncbi:MAG: hypothetical protein HUN04_19330 [Desulfobacter sp.]|nr:MAG: hypothetical protein HUN04_19330 [Desulfobacter sp.]
MSIATKNYIKNSIERLYGIIEGISIDYKVRDQEIIALKNWIDIHEAMRETEPFKGLSLLLEEILEDEVIDEQEREDLLEWCAETLNEKGYLENFTQVIRRLHGIFSGIICDRSITEEELEGLEEWLLDYEGLHDWWPINELRAHIQTILNDGKIDTEEHRLLKEFFSDFEEQLIDEPHLHDDEYWLNCHMRSPAPIFKSISSICEKAPRITFKGKKFCLTGPAASGKRKDLFSVIEKLGGSPHNTAIKKLDYLIIGAQASPAWVYSTYGRKIETVMHRKKHDERCQTKIVRELDFITAVKNIGGDAILPDPNRPLF